MCAPLKPTILFPFSLTAAEYFVHIIQMGLGQIDTVKLFDFAKRFDIVIAPTASKIWSALLKHFTNSIPIIPRACCGKSIGAFGHLKQLRAKQGRYNAGALICTHTKHKIGCSEILADRGKLGIKQTLFFKKTYFP